jgi:hypothetical protein
MGPEKMAGVACPKGSRRCRPPRAEGALRGKQLEAGSGMVGLSAARYKEAPVLQQRQQRGHHVHRGQIDVFNQEPPRSARHAFAEPAR